MRKWLNRLLLGVVVLIGLPAYWLLVDNRPGASQSQPVSIAQLRKLAASLPGAEPVAVEMEQVASRNLPKTLFAAGTGLRPHTIAVMAFRLPVPGGKAIVIDSGITPALAEAMGMGTFHARRQTRVDQALRSAGIVLITHEHPDHQGALLALSGPALQQAAWLNAGQLPPSPLATTLQWPQGPLPAARIQPGLPQAVAPGVVVIPAPSHTPGSQMIYARLANGREYLFAGDIATLEPSWHDIRARSRLVGDWFAPEDRRAVFSWLRTIKALKQDAPQLFIVPGHDLDPMLHTVTGRAAVRQGFTSEPIT